MVISNNTNQVKERPKSDVNIEEIDSIGSVFQMYQKYVFPIDRFRSIASSPNSAINTYNSGQNIYNISVDSSKFMESRISAFYRMIGFPVATSVGYYNSGHDPNQRNTTEIRNKINKSFINEPFNSLVLNREVQVKDRLNVFSKQDDLSSLYAILLPLTKNFLVAKEDKGPFDPDPQNQPINLRNEKIQTLNTSNLNIPSFFVNCNHILKPFIVHPDNSETVMDESKIICVPFLEDKQSTKLHSDIYLKRPILEYIIRQRLKIADQKSDTEKVATILKSINVESLEAVDDPSSVLSTEYQLINKNITSRELSTILIYSKAIRSAIYELKNSIVEFNKIRASTRIQPIPDQRGPEFGGKVSTINSTEEISAQKRKEALLKLKQLLQDDLSSAPGEESTIGDNSVFASAEIFDLTKNTTQEINVINNKLSNDGDKLLNSLKVIEIVTGEISGIGLIDILAIYTTLWSIDLRYLIGFLDTNSLTRLCSVNNGNYLNNFEVMRQNSGDRPTIDETLTEFERIFFNILTYSDKVFDSITTNPTSANRGKIGTV